MLEKARKGNGLGDSGIAKLEIEYTHGAPGFKKIRSANHSKENNASSNFKVQIDFANNRPAV